MKDLARDIMLSVITGDALGTPLDGMGSGHIKSCFGSLSGFTDPEPALRGKMERWKKPGLYSSISQLMLLLSVSRDRRGRCVETFARMMASSRSLSESGYGIFRNADAAESGFIAACRERRPAPAQSPLVSARIIPTLAPIALGALPRPELMEETVRFLRLFTADRQTIAAGLLYAFLLDALAGGGADPVRAAVDCASELGALIAGESSALVFAAGVNPDALLGEVRVLADILSFLGGCGSVRTAEDIICAHLNGSLKNRITRATINMPAALVPFAVSFASIHREDGDLPYRAAAEGGSSAPFTAIVVSLAAPCRGTVAVPEALLQGLVNRRRIVSIVDELAGGSPSPSLAEDFIASEASLSAKAEEELRARNRHSRKKPDRKTPSRADREQALARHVVESWTKLDKAKWRRERKQKAPEDEP
jgi:hypothetical protein